MTKYPAAERIALDLTLADGDLEEHVRAWAEVYADRIGRGPSPVETDVARGLLAQRLEGLAPPIPPSASSTAMRIPRVEFGLPGGES